MQVSFCHGSTSPRSIPKQSVTGKDLVSQLDMRGQSIGQNTWLRTKRDRFDSYTACQADEVDWQSTRSEPLYHNLPVAHTKMGCQTQWLATCNAWPFSSAHLDGRKSTERRQFRRIEHCWRIGNVDVKSIQSTPSWTINNAIGFADSAERGRRKSRGIVLPNHGRSIGESPPPPDIKLALKIYAPSEPAAIVGKVLITQSRALLTHPMVVTCRHVLIKQVPRVSIRRK